MPHLPYLRVPPPSNSLARLRESALQSLMHSSTGSSLSMGSEAKAEGMTGCCKMVSAGPKDRGRTQEGKCELDAGTGHDTRTTEGSPAALKELHVTHLWQGCCCLNPLGVVMLISMRWWGYSSILGSVWWINLPVRHRKKSRWATVPGRPQAFALASPIVVKPGRNNTDNAITCWPRATRRGDETSPYETPRSEVLNRSSLSTVILEKMGSRSCTRRF